MAQPRTTVFYQSSLKARAYISLCHILFTTTVFRHNTEIKRTKGRENLHSTALLYSFGRRAWRGCSVPPEII